MRAYREDRTASETHLQRINVYKANLLNVSSAGFARRIYIDLGANKYQSSIGSWLRNKYPGGRDFHVIAFEPETALRATYESSGDANLEFHWLAAWIRSETLRFEVRNKIRYNAASEDGSLSRGARTFASVPALDTAEFLRTRLTRDDFVVLKMDVEGAEYDLIPHLIHQNVTHLLDEVFVEAHYIDHNPINAIRGKHLKNAVQLMHELRARACLRASALSGEI